MRRKILPIVFFTIPFLMSVITIIREFTDNELKLVENILSIAWLVIAIFALLAVLIESIIFKMLFKKADNDVDKQIFVCESVLANCFVQWTATVCITSLLTLYLLKNDLEKAKDAATRMAIISGEYVSAGLYNNYILAVYENDFESAQIYYEKLMKIKSKKFSVQQETAKLIQEMIDCGKYNETIYNSTKFEIVKEICLRYKNKEIM